MIFWSCHGLHGWVAVAASSMPFASASPNRRERASSCRPTASLQVADLPERISISDSISSPATASARTGSSSAASFSSVKRWASALVPGSRIWNSSSIASVKSVEASKTSRVRAMSSMGLGQVEVQRVEQVDGGAGRVDRDVRRRLEQSLGVVEDDLHAGLDEIVGDLLRG